jgi:hypothetical protein
VLLVGRGRGGQPLNRPSLCFTAVCWTRGPSGPLETERNVQQESKGPQAAHWWWVSNRMGWTEAEEFACVRQGILRPSPRQPATAAHSLLRRGWIHCNVVAAPSGFLCSRSRRAEEPKEQPTIVTYSQRASLLRPRAPKSPTRQTTALQVLHNGLEPRLRV